MSAELLTVRRVVRLRTDAKLLQYDAKTERQVSIAQGLTAAGERWWMIVKRKVHTLARTAREMRFWSRVYQEHYAKLDETPLHQTWVSEGCRGPCLPGFLKLMFRH